MYAQVYVALIAFFNYYYTFLQLEPKDLADSLKRQACHHSWSRQRVRDLHTALTSWRRAHIRTSGSPLPTFEHVAGGR